MTGISTGISLLSVSTVKLVNLTYSTANYTTVSNITATASPDPDGWGQTGFSSTGSRGVQNTVDSAFLTAVSSGNYPNYILSYNIIPQRMGGYGGTGTPIIKDSSGITGTISGGIPIILTRDYRWGTITNLTRTASSATKTIGIFFNNTDEHFLGELDTSTSSLSVLYNGGKWTTNPTSNMGIYNQVRITAVSGATSALRVYLGNGTSLGSSGTTGVWYDINNIFTIIDPTLVATNASVVVQVEFRNKLTNAFTFAETITLTRNI